MLTETAETGLIGRLLTSRSHGARFRVSRRTILLLLSTAAMVIGAVALSLGSFEQLSHLSQERVQTRQQIDNIIDLLSSLKDAETGQRGYLLTGDETYLAPYNTVRDTLMRRISELRTHPGPLSTQKLLDQIEQLTNAKLAELAATIDMKRRRESASAIALVMNGNDRQLMDALRADIAKLLLEQQQIRDRQLQENEVDQHHLLEGIITTGLLALLLSMTTSALTLRSARHYVDRRLHAVIDSAMDAIITIDENSVIQLFNPAACSMYGIAESEAIGHSIDRFIPKRFRHDHHSHLQEFDSSGISLRHQGNPRAIVGLRADGREFPGEATISQVSVGGQKLFTVIVRDQTNRMLAEQALRDSEAFNIATLNSVEAEIAVLDQEGTIMKVNQSWLDFAKQNCFPNGAVPNQVQVGANYLAVCKNSNVPQVYEGIKSVMAGTSPGFNLSYPCESANAERWFHMSVTPMQTSYGKVVISHTDITSVKLAERALQASQETLRDLLEYGHRKKEQERSRTAQVIHDELGTRLTAAKANLSVLMDQDQRNGIAKNPRLTQACELLDASFDTVRNVILELRPSVLDNLGIWSALEWYAGKSAKNTGIICNFFIEPTLEHHAPAPELRSALFRILQETLSNVTLHSQATEVTVRISTEHQFIKMEVEDNGSGIDMKKVHQFKSWGIAGMGERARYLGGSIDIAESACGTLVTVLLPLESSQD